MSDQVGARLWHPWLRVQRLLRSMLTERWNEEAWKQGKPEIEGARAEEQDRARGLV